MIRAPSLLQELYYTTEGALRSAYPDDREREVAQATLALLLLTQGLSPNEAAVKLYGLADGLSPHETWATMEPRT